MSRDYIPRGLRDLVARTARYRCGYCLTQEAVVGTPMVIDHIVPESLGGGVARGFDKARSRLLH
jgi:5-methylcytosine-specific restriction endonuclease McrA